MLKFISISAVCIILIASGWFIIRTLGADPRTSALNMHPDNFEKAPIEWVSNLNQEIKEDETIIDLEEYLAEQEIKAGQNELD